MSGQSAPVAFSTGFGRKRLACPEYCIRITPTRAATGDAVARRDLTGAVNFTHLESYAAGDEQVVEEVLALFREQSALWLRLLDAESEGWRDAVHTIKGSALGVGAGELAQVCARAEMAPATERSAYLDRVRDALDRALTDIAAYAHEQALRSLKSPPAPRL